MKVIGFAGYSGAGKTALVEALVMLILGGAGQLSGALVGATVFTLLHHTAASINPYHWLFVVGGLLMLVGMGLFFVKRSQSAA